MGIIPGPAPGGHTRQQAPDIATGLPAGGSSAPRPGARRTGIKWKRATGGHPACHTYGRLSWRTSDTPVTRSWDRGFLQEDGTRRHEEERRWQGGKTFRSGGSGPLRRKYRKTHHRICKCGFRNGTLRSIRGTICGASHSHSCSDTGMSWCPEGHGPSLRCPS